MLSTEMYPTRTYTQHKIDRKETDEEPDDEHEIKEQLQALTEAIQLLTMSITSTCSSTKDMDRQNDLYADQELDKLEKRWKLEQTGFARLYNACKQLKENLRLTVIEADDSIKDVNSVQQELVNEKTKMNKMNRAIKALYKENKTLRKTQTALESQLKSCKKEKKAIVHGIRGYIHSTRGEMEVEKVDVQDDSEIGLVSGQLDAFLETEEKEPNSTAMNNSLEESIETLVTTFEIVSSEESEEEEDPASPISTCSSLITDEGCATLRLSKRLEKPSGTFSFLRNVIRATTNTYELEFTSNPGLQFMRLPPNVKVDANMNASVPIFLICGFMGFLERHHQRTPIFGARLISIDSYSLEHEEWTMQDLVDSIKMRKALLQMKFRNDEISEANMVQLKMKNAELSKRFSR